MKPTPSAEHRFLGKGSASATNRPSIKAVPRKLQAFVSRLDLKTTTDDLVTWFGSVGIADVQCYKVDPPAGRKFTTAAFKLHAMSDMRNYSMMRLTGLRDAMLGIGMSVIRVALILMSVMIVALIHVLMTCSCHRNG